MVDYEGRQAYAIVSPRTTSIMNPANYNTMFITRDGQSARKNTPDNGDFSWPLWVGKAWTSTYFYNDFKLGRVFQISATIKVAAYEDITVPAGTFKAFRLEYTPERNNASSGMYWYAPSIKLVVKSAFFTGGTAAVGTYRNTVELISLPQ